MHPSTRSVVSGNMTPTRALFRSLVVLLFSPRLDAFHVCPLTKSSVVSCRRIGPLPCTPKARARPQSPLAEGGSLRKWADGRFRGGALRMVTDTVLEIEVADLEEREFQLEELEDRDVSATSVVLKTDGSIEAGATNGPLPLSCRGTWSFKDKKFTMEISREFDASIPYTVSRVLTGSIEEVLPATDTVIISGDITMEEMEDMEVGFFKMISAPSDILDSLERVDKQAESVLRRE